MPEIENKIKALKTIANAMNSCTNIPAVMILANRWVALYTEVRAAAPEAVRFSVL